MAVPWRRLRKNPVTVLARVRPRRARPRLWATVASIRATLACSCLVAAI